MQDLAGKTILQLRKRLGEDWPDLALYFDIPRERCKGFAPGRECDGVVAWLKEQERLGELTEALAAVDRDDLIPLLEVVPSPASQPTAPGWPRSPFPGLRRFNPDDAPIFFGRHREIKGLLRKFADPAHRFIAVLGASGSGKSSLVAAGLIPRLEADALPGSKDWPWLEFTPGGVKGDPYPILAARLEPLLKHHGLRVSEITETLETERGYGGVELAKQVLSNLAPQAELLLFVDQFEELFTLTRDALRQPFVRLLTTTARAPRVRVVVAMRADFLHRCLEYPGLDRLLSANAYFLGSPGPGTLYEMMTGPAAKAGLEFDEGLVERILEGTGTGSGALALLAFALHELYESRTENGRLTHGAYDSFGGVQHAISQRAESTFQRLDGAAQAELALVFRELVQMDERGVATRQRAPLSTLAVSSAASELIDRFVDARLLVREPGEDGLPVVEVAQEALFRTWPRLKQWIQDTADDHRLRRQIAQLAAYWHDHDRKDEYRWPDERVVEVVAMREHLKLEPKDFTALERDFLGPLDRDQMLAALDDPATTHEQRAIIGVRLSLLGDPRPGVGLRADGLPEIVWCEVPGGEVTLKDNAGTFTVETFDIAKYPVTYRQYRAFLEAPDGFNNPVWWKELGLQMKEPGKQLNQYDNHPVMGLCWLDAVAFCRWLSIKLGYEVRLPTEWEWQQSDGGEQRRNGANRHLIDKGDIPVGSREIMLTLEAVVCWNRGGSCTI